MKNFGKQESVSGNAGVINIIHIQTKKKNIVNGIVIIKGSDYIKYLIIPIGCSCAGKTYLYENLIKNDTSRVCSIDALYRELFYEKIRDGSLSKKEQNDVSNALCDSIQENIDNPLINVIYIDSTCCSIKETRKSILKNLKYDPEKWILIFINFNNSFEQIYNNHEKRYFSILDKLKKEDCIEMRKKIPYITKEKLFRLYSEVEHVTQEEIKNYFFKDIFIFNIGDKND